MKKWTTSHESSWQARFHHININLLRSSFWTPKIQRHLWSCLIYNVDNDTREEELGIESVCTGTFRKIFFMNYFCTYILQKTNFFRKRKKPMTYNVAIIIIFCSPPQKIFIFLCALERIKLLWNDFLKMIFVLSWFLSLVHSSKIH